MWGMKKISFYKGALTKNIFLGDAFKLEKDGPIFSIFSPCPSWPSVRVAKDRDRKQFQGLNIVLLNKMDHCFWN